MGMPYSRETVQPTRIRIISAYLRAFTKDLEVSQVACQGSICKTVIIDLGFAYIKKVQINHSIKLSIFHDFG